MRRKREEVSLGLPILLVAIALILSCLAAFSIEARWKKSSIDNTGRKTMKTDYFYCEPELLDAVRANDDDYIAALKQARDILADGLEQLRIAEERRIFNELRRIVGGWK